MDSKGMLLWVSPDGRGSGEAVEASARDFKLTVRSCGYREVFDQMRAEHCALVGIEIGADRREALALVKELVIRKPDLAVFVASSDTGVEMIRTAIQAGASDFLSLPINPAELHKALIKLTQPGTKATVSRTAVGDVITVCGARGGLGATTVAVNLAFRIAGMTGANVGLVDLDLQRGDVAAFLNLTPSNSLATIAAAQGPVDEIFLAGTLTRHPSGVFVLPAPPQIEEADSVGHDEVDLALRLLRAQFRYTVVDTARMITGATLGALEQTDRVLLLADLSVPGVRAARRTIELFARLEIPLERVELVITQARPGPVPMQDAVRAIGKSPFLVIPRDDAAASSSMNGGTPLNGGSSALALTISELAARLTGVQTAPKARGLFQRVFSKEVRR